MAAGGRAVEAGAALTDALRSEPLVSSRAVLARLRYAIGTRLRGAPPKAPPPPLRPGQTSASDTADYTGLCARAAADDAVFATFKRAPAYTAILEHVTYEQGKAYLEHAVRQTPDLVASFDRFRENDRLGAPRTFDYGEYGRFSPTTLRYVNVLSDLRVLFGGVDGLRVLEIGAGYGGQCFVASVASSPASWTIVDLDAPRALQRKYLERLGVPNVGFLSADALSASAHEFDLVISNYAFSECTRSVQEHYLDHAIRRTPRGYVTCNWVSPEEYEPYSRAELVAAVAGSHFLPEVLDVPVDIGIWVWGDRSSERAA